MCRIVTLASVLAGFLVLSEPGRASLFQPEDPMIVPVGPDGRGEPLVLPEFKRRLVSLLNVSNPGLKGGAAADRNRVLARVAKARQAGASLSPEATAALATDLIRLGELNEAVDRLKPLYDDRERKGTRTYAVVAALIHAHAMRQEWNQALNYLPDLLDARPPAAGSSLSLAQRDWLVRIDRDYLPQYLRIRKIEADTRVRTSPEDEDPTPLFSGDDSGPVRFVNDAGKYQPGVLAAAEKAKLPADAIAIVQQLLLWFPNDARLYWLLGEVYAANGQLQEAAEIMDDCVSASRQYGNRKMLAEHRVAVRAAAAAMPRTNPGDKVIALPGEGDGNSQPKDQDPAKELPINMKMIWVYFGAVGLVAAVAIIRVFVRRRSRRGALRG